MFEKNGWNFPAQLSGENSKAGACCSKQRADGFASRQRKLSREAREKSLQKRKDWTKLHRDKGICGFRATMTSRLFGMSNLTPKLGAAERQVPR